MSFLSAALGIAGSLFGANRAQRAANQQANTILEANQERTAMLRELAAPYEEAGLYGMDRLKALISGSLAPAVGRESPILAGEHQENLLGIGRDTGRQLAGSTRYWTGAGNVGRGRGEGLRIQRAGTDARNRENLRYGGLQEDYKDRALGRYQGALGAMADYGRTGTSLMAGAANAGYEGAVQAAGVRGAGQQAFAEDLGALGGTLFGSWEADRERRLMQPYLDKALGTGGDVTGYDTMLVPDPTTGGKRLIRRPRR